MKWEILMLSMPSREKYRDQALALLEPQIREAQGDVKLTIVPCDGSPVGFQKQKMKVESTGDYISFFDDDDFPSPVYIRMIYPKLDGVDYVGFKIRLVKLGSEPTLERTSIHSLRYEQWTQSPDGRTLYRGISHCNPMRRELSLAVPMSGGWGEDFRWQKELSDKRLVMTEHFIDRTAFYYMESSGRDEATGWKDPRRLGVYNQLEEGLKSVGLL